MAALAVGLISQPCALLKYCARVNVSRSIGSQRLAWNPLSRSCSGREGFMSARRKELRISAAPATWRASSSNEGDEQIEEDKKKVENHGLFVRLSDSLRSTVSSAAKPAAVVFLAGLLLLQPMDEAMAAGGGRMGGRVFKSAPAPSRSYSGGGGGGGGSRSYAAPPIYGSPYGYGSYGFSPFSPFGGGYGYGGGGLLLGPAVGFGGGGGFFLFAMLAFVTLRAVSGFLRNRNSDRDDFDD